MRMMSALSTQIRVLSFRVQATGAYQREVEASPTSGPSTSHPRWRARCQVSPHQDPDMAEEVHHCVDTRIRKLPTSTETTTEGDSTSDKEEQLAPRWRKLMKPDMHRTGATAVLNKVTWPHEIVYTTVGKPATYEDISVSPLCARIHHNH